MSETEVRSRRRIKQIEVMVAETIAETHDTRTLILFTGNDRLEYRPGHFLTLDPHDFPELERFTAYLEDVKGKKEAARAYSLASAPHEKYLAITIKEERYVSTVTPFPPLLSPLLVNRTGRGTKMVVTGFTGPYYLPEDIETRTDHLVHVCAGSGIVPNMSIIKFALAQGLKVRHTLIYGNKTWGDVIYRAQLRGLERQHPNQLRVVHALTRDEGVTDDGQTARRGRVDEALLRELVPDPSAAEFFVCGPGLTKWDKKTAKDKGVEPGPRFLESVLSALGSMGVKNERLHEESYG